MKFLTKTVETYRVATEAEAQQLIEEAKKDKRFTLLKYLNEYREQKQKGEVVDSWYRLTLTKNFNEEKEPYCYVDITYDVSDGIFPDADEEEVYED